MTDAAPPPERLQHDRIERAAEQIVDAMGVAGAPWRVEGLLGRLERSGAIGARERMAGETFQKCFRLAGMDPLRAAGMAQRTHGSVPDAPLGIWARERINMALDALGGLGSPCGTACWFVLGCEMSLREWALREGWGGKPIREEVAKGTLVGALGVLARHYGL
jgi:hypothetical protein